MFGVYGTFCDVCHAFVSKSWFCLCNVYLPFVLHLNFEFDIPMGSRLFKGSKKTTNDVDVIENGQKY